MKYALDFLLEFPETDQGRNDFKSIFDFLSTLPKEDRQFFPSSINEDPIEGILTYPKIWGDLRISNEVDFAYLLGLLKNLKSFRLPDSQYKINHHVCSNDEGVSCPDWNMDTNIVEEDI